MKQHDHIESALRRSLAGAPSAMPSSDFDLNPQYAPENPSLRAAAVLIALQSTAQGWQVVLTRRSSALKNHPGQIAFAGGKIDATDHNAQSAALREAHEEIGLHPDHVDIIGSLPTHQTVTSFLVTPFVGLITQPFEPRAEQGEVAEIFTTPLTHLLQRDNYLIHSRIWQQKNRKYYAIPYGPYYIWGATARMLRMLAELMDGADEN